MSIALLAGVSAWAQDPATVSVYEDCSKNGKTEDIRPTGEENGHTWVNLGLPSGLKWASCNIGATTPDGYGNYYAWGETETKDDYSWENYKHANGAKDKLTKYCYDASSGNNGFTDSKTTLESEDDAATANWGDDWRMPTDAEWTELQENCTWTWTTQNGVNGYQVASKTNGNSIFLPAAGYRYNASLSSAGSEGYYWSSSLSGSDPDYAWYFNFGSDYVVRYDFYRYLGIPVRPVCPLPASPTQSATHYTLTLYANGCESANTILCDAGQQVSITAVPENAHRHFVRWSDGNTDNPRTISVTKDSTFIAEFAQEPTAVSVYEDCNKNGKTEDIRSTTGEENGHTWVDLGLPSGLKWASCNIGATTPEGYGNYYAWGETTTKEDYSWETYKHANGAYNKLTKYCYDASSGNNGFTDSKTTLESEDDAATANWGDDWRMPTDAEWTELQENCTWTWTTQNGVNGYQVASKTNGNSIFLPAAGYRYDTYLIDAGSGGYYWSSSLYTSRPYSAWHIGFDSDGVRRRGSNRYNGQSVRPVCPLSTNVLTLTLKVDGCESANVIQCNAEQKISINAVPENAHRHFVRWSDGNTDNPRTVVVTQDTTFTAEFAIDQHTVTTNAQNGTITGGGTYDYGTTATLTATADEHYHFTQWNDGNTDNPRTISVEGDATYTAEFAIDQHTITVSCAPQQGNVTGAGMYDYGTSVTLTATANAGYRFEQWSNGVKDNPYLFTATEDLTIEAQFVSDPATAVENVSADGDTAVRKVFRDGQVYILRNGKTYTTTGVEVK